MVRAAGARSAGTLRQCHATLRATIGQCQKRTRALSVGGRGYWLTENLWRAARDLPVHQVRIDDIPELDEDCWFDGRGPTCREVAEHTRRIQNADLSRSVIFGADGRLMDGGHRIARAWLDGLSEVQAVRFVTDPEPDWVERPGQ